METFPFVSILTPTYNRRKFIPWLIKCYNSQKYPKNRMEWIIFDDGTDSVRDLFEKENIPNLRYIYQEGKSLIGVKRNRLVQEAKGEILIAFDDDDFYPEERVQHCVTKFKQYPSVELAGSSEIYMYYTDNKQIYKLGPYGPNHCTNGTLAIRKSYALNHKYDETVYNAEEKSFLDNYRNPMIQLDPMKTMLVMSHSQNTFDKKRFRDQPDNPFVRKSDMKIRDFIKDTKMREFFSGA
jgi:glycosyltransferase involved in cell wall biosynthesis